MKIMITGEQASWVNSNVSNMMDFAERVEFGFILHKVTRGYAAAIISEKLLTKIIEYCINAGRGNHYNFYALCAKMHKVMSIHAKEDDPKFCIHFSTNQGDKINSIKALRDLIKNDFFINFEGRKYFAGLKEVKDAIESDVVLGPYTPQQIESVRVMLGYAPYEVVPYNGQKTLSDIGL